MCLGRIEVEEISVAGTSSGAGPWVCKKKAVVAVAHGLLLQVYQVLRTQQPLAQAPSPPLDEQRRKRIVRHHLRCLGRLGSRQGQRGFLHTVSSRSLGAPRRLRQRPGGDRIIIFGANHCHRFRGFVYHNDRFRPDKKAIEIGVRPRVGSAAVCAGCHKPAPGYDHLPERRFEFIPFWGILVFLLYRMRRKIAQTVAWWWRRSPGAMASIS